MNPRRILLVDDNPRDTELAIDGDPNRYARSDWRLPNACDKCRRLTSSRADSDHARLTRNSLVANIDIVIARSEVYTGEIAQRDVAAAGCVELERSIAGGSVVAAGGVQLEGIKTAGRVVDAVSVELERMIADRGVKKTIGVATECIIT